jgi:hypothetical protein
VELLIQHAFEIFEVDRQNDWTEYFEKYNDVEEPKPVNAEEEAKLNLPDDESKEILDDLDEFDVDCDEEVEPTYSSSSISQLPPTHDMVRNAAKGRQESCKLF